MSEAEKNLMEFFHFFDSVKVWNNVTDCLPKNFDHAKKIYRKCKCH
jgi:hypothetical protein